ncbi:hypothetical protein BRD13_01260 [Halobacteriales archaeon SW_5_70_135]|nr:MAG: hypothetical protein BRD13_01260 [Halobacteriales archaeon SW_5_70_135]
MLLQIDPQTLGLQLGTGAVIGGLVGYFAKKVAKVLAFIVGLELALFAFLEKKGYMSVRWDALSGGLLDAGETAAEVSDGWVAPTVSAAAVTGGFAGGLYLGFWRG